MSMMKTVSEAINNFGPSLKSIGKMIFLSHPASVKKVKAQGSISILANGPSLRQTLDNQLAQLKETNTMAVNFAANTPEFWELKPNYYIIVDPYFFVKMDQERVKKLWDNICDVKWPMSLIVPFDQAEYVEKYFKACEITNVTIRSINPVGVEGWHWLENLAYKRGWGMPRPRNVLIAAIMAAIQMGFEDIVLYGADHSWMQSIWVDDNNCVVTVQPHYYKEDEESQKQVNSEYSGIPLHEVVHSFYVAFQAYHRIARYARGHSVTIINATPGSFIDAFPRKRIKD